MKRLCLSLLLAHALPLDAASTQQTRPNVLFIAIDDLNDWIGCMGGHPQAKTPHLDRLAKSGVMFTSAQCPAPYCQPSRTAIFSGLRPSTTGIYHHLDVPFRQSARLKEAVTLTQHFKAGGYEVRGAGKVLHHGEPPSAAGGWDDYWPSQRACMQWDEKPTSYPANGLPRLENSLDWFAFDKPRESMADWKVTDYVVQQLAQAHEQPFFLACGFFRPHSPLYAPREYFDRFPLDSIQLPRVPQDDLDDVPDYARKLNDDTHQRIVKAGKWKEAVQAYLACTAFVDDCVGRVLDALDASPHKDNTIVMLWSDHGWHLGEKNHWTKVTLWEEATRTVFMVRAPGVTPAGKVCQAPVSLINIYPTLIDLCGLPARAELEGVSLRPLLSDPAASGWTLPAVTTLRWKSHAVRTKDWKYIRYADGSEELYDEQQDPDEWNNLAGKPEHAAIIRELAQSLPEHDEIPFKVGRPDSKPSSSKN